MAILDFTNGKEKEVSREVTHSIDVPIPEGEEPEKIQVTLDFCGEHIEKSLDSIAFITLTKTPESPKGDISCSCGLVGACCLGDLLHLREDVKNNLLPTIEKAIIKHILDSKKCSKEEVAGLMADILHSNLSTDPNSPTLVEEEK